MLPAGADLLHGLSGTICRFRQGPIALAADIESTFLQVQVQEQDRSCLRFLWRPRTNEPVQMYEYQRHVFGVLQFLQTILSSEWDWTMKRSIRLKQRNTKQFLHGRFHQIGRNP